MLYFSYIIQYRPKCKSLNYNTSIRKQGKYLSCNRQRLIKESTKAWLQNKVI